MLITPQEKDAVLREIVGKFEPGSLAILNRVEGICGVNGSTLSEMINHFERIGLLSYDTTSDGRRQSGSRESIMFKVNLESHDFLQKGGFYGHYELFQKTVERLLWQVERLEQVSGDHKQEVRDIGKKISEYVGLIANLGSIGDNVSDMFNDQ